MNYEGIISKEVAKTTGRQVHVSALRRLNSMHETAQEKFSRLEMYHLAALHRRWFSSSKRERYATS